MIHEIKVCFLGRVRLFGLSVKMCLKNICVPSSFSFILFQFNHNMRRDLNSE